MASKVIPAPQPMQVSATLIKKPEDLEKIIKAADDRTIVLNDAHHLGFMSDRVLVVPGAGGDNIDAGKVADTHHTPVMTQTMFVKVLRHMHGNAK